MSSAATERLRSVRLSGTPLFFSRVRAWVGVISRGGKTPRRLGNHFVDISPEGGLIVLHGQLIMRSVFHHQLSGRFILGVQRVQSHRAVRQIQVAEEFASHWNLIGFGIDQRAAKVELTRHADRRQDGITGAVAGFLAINGNQFIGRWLPPHLPLDAQQHLVKATGLQSGEQSRESRLAGSREKPAGLGLIPKARRWCWVNRRASLAKSFCPRGASHSMASSISVTSDQTG